MIKAQLKPGVKPGLSLCMIVKNEEHYLEGCLESAKSLVDEIIILDTGSTDKTIEIAKKYTDNIYHFEWCNDFSKARNESLKHATKEWILYLDADERLQESQLQDIRDLMKRPEFGAYMLNLKCYSDMNDYSKYEMAVYRRMFRNYENVYFKGKVHEQVYYSLKELGVVTANTSIIIEHLGYAVSDEIMDAKKERNLTLLQENLKLHPNDSYTWHQLSGTFVTMNRYEEAYMPAMKALSLPDITPAIKARCYNILSIISAHYKEYYRCIFYARESIKIAPNQLHALYYMADSFYALGLYEGALDKYHLLFSNSNIPESRRKQEITTDITMQNWQIYQAFVRCYDKLEDYEKVIEYSIKTLDDNPKLIEVNYQLAITYTKLEQFDISELYAQKLNTDKHKSNYLLAMGFLEKAKKKCYRGAFIF